MCKRMEALMLVFILIDNGYLWQCICLRCSNILHILPISFSTKWNLRSIVFCSFYVADILCSTDSEGHSIRESHSMWSKWNRSESEETTFCDCYSLILHFTAKGDFQGDSWHNQSMFRCGGCLFGKDWMHLECVN